MISISMDQIDTAAPMWYWLAIAFVGLGSIALFIYMRVSDEKEAKNKAIDSPGEKVEKRDSLYLVVIFATFMILSMSLSGIFTDGIKTQFEKSATQKVIDQGVSTLVLKETTSQAAIFKACDTNFTDSSTDIIWEKDGKAYSGLISGSKENDSSCTYELIPNSDESTDSKN